MRRGGQRKEGEERGGRREAEEERLSLLLWTLLSQMVDVAPGVRIRKVQCASKIATGSGPNDAHGRSRSTFENSLGNRRKTAITGHGDYETGSVESGLS